MSNMADQLIIGNQAYGKEEFVSIYHWPEHSLGQPRITGSVCCVCVCMCVSVLDGIGSVISGPIATVLPD